jgi:hypothetical protein
MPGKKTNRGRDGVAGVQAVSRKVLKVVIMIYECSSASLG